MTRPFTIRLTEADRAALALLAEREERTAGDVLRRLLRRAAGELTTADRRPAADQTHFTTQAAAA